MTWIFWCEEKVIDDRDDYVLQSFFLLFLFRSFFKIMLCYLAATQILNLNRQCFITCFGFELFVILVQTKNQIVKRTALQSFFVFFLVFVVTYNCRRQHDVNILTLWVSYVWEMIVCSVFFSFFLQKLLSFKPCTQLYLRSSFAKPLFVVCFGFELL